MPSKYCAGSLIRTRRGGHWMFSNMYCCCLCLPTISIALSPKDAHMCCAHVTVSVTVRSLWNCGIKKGVHASEHQGCSIRPAAHCLLYSGLSWGKAMPLFNFLNRKDKGRPVEAPPVGPAPKPKPGPKPAERAAGTDPQAHEASVQATQAQGAVAPVKPQAAEVGTASTHVAGVAVEQPLQKNQSRPPASFPKGSAKSLKSSAQPPAMAKPSAQPPAAAALAAAAVFPKTDPKPVSECDSEEEEEEEDEEEEDEEEEDEVGCACPCILCTLCTCVLFIPSSVHPCADKPAMNEQWSTKKPPHRTSIPNVTTGMSWWARRWVRRKTSATTSRSLKRWDRLALPRGK